MKTLNGAMGLDQLEQGAFPFHNAGQSHFQLIQVVRARYYGCDAADAGAGGRQ